MKACIPHPRDGGEILCAPAEGLPKRSENSFVQEARPKSASFTEAGLQNLDDAEGIWQIRKTKRLAFRALYTGKISFVLMTLIPRYPLVIAH